MYASQVLEFRQLRTMDETNNVRPRDGDVLFGRGISIMGHPGNQHFRSVVDSRKAEFLSTRKNKDKRAISISIVQGIKARNGRFLTEDPNQKSEKGEGIDERAWVCRCKIRSWKQALFLTYFLSGRC